ncbi:MAG TPA: RIP metalloprotease RseP [Gammaproteobacteria bacterium]|nr:RIP metalloprotease RseP [Gammaproteobacteria bacterium]
MLNTLITIGSFLLAIGVLITVHEYGHFLIARLLGVKVLRFSIGFGKPLAMWHGGGADRTEYAIAPIPLGGYCKMLDEREGEVDASEQHRAFNRQPLPKRAAILFAGPGFNLLLAVICYWVVFMTGVPGLRPVVGVVTPHSAAAEAGIGKGDEIVAVGGAATPTWQAVELGLLNSVMNGGPLSLKVKPPRGTPHTVELQPQESSKNLTKPGQLLPGLGLTIWRPTVPAVLGQVLENGPAASAGLQVGDKVVESGGHAIHTWHQWVQFIQQRPDQTVPVTVIRNGSRLKLHLHIGVTQGSRGGQRIGHIGAGARVPPGFHDRMFTVQQYAPLPALARAFGQTGQFSWLTLKTIWGMIAGQVSWKSLMGPVGIAQYAGSAASAGLTAFVTFLALISISLGIANLFPIPMLDGGQLLYCAIEWIKGRPLSLRSQMLGQQIGITLLLALLSFTVFNDLTRIAG